jgi:hypothetical protein
VRIERSSNGMAMIKYAQLTTANTSLVIVMGDTAKTIRNQPE